MVLRKFIEITNNKPTFSQCNTFLKYKYFFFQSVFWSLFNHWQKSQSIQKQGIMCCSSLCFRVLLCNHYEALQCFSTYFLKWKEIGVLWPIFLDYVISCDYRQTIRDDEILFHHQWHTWLWVKGSAKISKKGIVIKWWNLC